MEARPDTLDTSKNTGMDNEFPCQLFSCFFNDGPPNDKRDGNIGGWRSYKHVTRVSASKNGSIWGFASHS